MLWAHACFDAGPSAETRALFDALVDRCTARRPSARAPARPCRSTRRTPLSLYTAHAAHSLVALLRE
jgi:hypothetical protein